MTPAVRAAATEIPRKIINQGHLAQTIQRHKYIIRTNGEKKNSNNDLQVPQAVKKDPNAFSIDAPARSMNVPGTNACLDSADDIDGSLGSSLFRRSVMDKSLTSAKLFSNISSHIWLSLKFY